MERINDSRMVKWIYSSECVLEIDQLRDRDNSELTQ